MTTATTSSSRHVSGILIYEDVIKNQLAAAPVESSGAGVGGGSGAPPRSSSSATSSSSNTMRRTSALGIPPQINSSLDDQQQSQHRRDARSESPFGRRSTPTTSSGNLTSSRVKSPGRFLKTMFRKKKPPTTPPTSDPSSPLPPHFTISQSGLRVELSHDEKDKQQNGACMNTPTRRTPPKNSTKEPSPRKGRSPVRDDGRTHPRRAGNTSHHAGRLRGRLVSPPKQDDDKKTRNVEQHTNNNASNRNKFNSRSVPSPPPNLSHRSHPSGSIDDRLLLPNANATSAPPSSPRTNVSRHRSSKSPVKAVDLHDRFCRRVSKYDGQNITINGCLAYELGNYLGGGVAGVVYKASKLQTMCPNSSSPPRSQESTTPPPKICVTSSSDNGGEPVTNSTATEEYAIELQASEDVIDYNHLQNGTTSPQRKMSSRREATDDSIFRSAIPASPQLSNSFKKSSIDKENHGEDVAIKILNPLNFRLVKPDVEDRFIVVKRGRYVKTKGISNNSPFRDRGGANNKSVGSNLSAVGKKKLSNVHKSFRNNKKGGDSYASTDEEHHNSSNHGGSQKISSEKQKSVAGPDPLKKLTHEDIWWIANPSSRNLRSLQHQASFKSAETDGNSVPSSPKSRQEDDTGCSTRGIRLSLLAMYCDAATHKLYELNLKQCVGMWGMVPMNLATTEVEFEQLMDEIDRVHSVDSLYSFLDPGRNFHHGMVGTKDGDADSISQYTQQSDRCSQDGNSITNSKRSNVPISPSTSTRPRQPPPSNDSGKIIYCASLDSHINLPSIPPKYLRWLRQRRAATREIRNMMKLKRHKNIVHLHEVVEFLQGNKSIMFLVLELVNGGELFDLISSGGGSGDEGSECTDQHEDGTKVGMGPLSVMVENLCQRRKKLAILEQKMPQHQSGNKTKAIIPKETSMMKRMSDQEMIMQQFFKELIAGIRYCHDNGIAHRDLKPENLLVHHDNNGDCILKIADFGLSATFSVPEPIEAIPQLTTPAKPSIQLPPPRSHPFNCYGHSANQLYDIDENDHRDDDNIVLSSAQQQQSKITDNSDRSSSGTAASRSNSSTGTPPAPVTGLSPLPASQNSGANQVNATAAVRGGFTDSIARMWGNSNYLSYLTCGQVGGAELEMENISNTPMMINGCEWQSRGIAGEMHKKNIQQQQQKNFQQQQNKYNAMPSPLRRMTSVVGSPHYVAPEIVSQSSSIDDATNHDEIRANKKNDTTNADTFQAGHHSRTHNHKPNAHSDENNITNDNNDNAPPSSMTRGYDGTKADVWSAGVILYAMLFRSLPFGEDLLRCPRYISFNKWYGEARKIKDSRRSSAYAALEDMVPNRGQAVPGSSAANTTAWSRTFTSFDDNHTTATMDTEGNQTVDEELEEMLGPHWFFPQPSDGCGDGGQPQMTVESRDLIVAMLNPDPSQRLCVDMVKQHPWFKNNNGILQHEQDRQNPIQLYKI
eukprot:CAMPEP_0194376218 /NCGR_PEP_ID=MMETSP0174-20130528/24669_1 /TAXON_ID=216777 /ORGANISM="Proboscia alata, Strain PI-D3" /LENGTH=1448 /DNA_ID=CAMNT_0039156795 /DNA_START=665 /DNA_END=5011 /DNA_ORIENTATION=-